MGLEMIGVLRKEKNMTINELSSKSGVPVNTLKKISAGITTDPNLSTVKAIARALGCSVDDFSDTSSFGSAFSLDERKMVKKYRALDGHGKEVVDVVLEKETARMTAELEKAEHSEPEHTPVIPFRRSLQPASAGTGTYLGPEEFEILSVKENDLTRRASFGVPVRGDSMEPTYHNGDTLVVDGDRDIRVGEIGVFTINGEGYVKELGDGVLISLNPEYDPIPMNESIFCNGRVIGVLEPEWVVE